MISILSYMLFSLTAVLFLLWLIDQIFFINHHQLKARQQTEILEKNKQPLLRRAMTILPYLLLLSIIRLFFMLKQGLNFDFNYLLVPVTLLLLFVIVVDKVYYKDRKTLGKSSERSLISNSYDFFPVLAFVLVVRSFVFEPFNIPSSSMVPTLHTGDFIVVNKTAYGVRLPLSHQKIINLGSPKHGDVAVFRYPQNPQLYYIKRVIGLPGDTLRYENKSLFINGKKIVSEQIQFQPEQLLTDNIVSVGSLLNGKQLTVNESKQLSNLEESSAYYLKEAHGNHNYLTRHWADFESASMARFLQENSVELTISEGSQWEITVPEGSYFVMGDNRDSSADSRFWGFVPENNLAGKAVYIWMHKQIASHFPSFRRNGAID